jgi:hypothetical protein
MGHVFPTQPRKVVIAHNKRAAYVLFSRASVGESGD